MLNQIKPTRQARPPRVVIHGAHKVGKSTFAAAAPRPIFVATEDGQDNIDAEAFPLCQSWQSVLDCITALYQEDHDYQTVVLDSGDWAERLAWGAVAKDHNVDSIEGIGYGKGYVFAADLFRELLDGLNALRNHKAMQVIVICHSEIKRFDDPLAQSYDRHQIKLHKLCGKMLQEYADVIGFCQIDSVTQTEDHGFKKERARVIDTGRRILRLAPSAAYDAGNRYGLPASIPLDYQAFADAMSAALLPG